MSTNHYAHIPPPPMNLHVANTNKQKSDFGPPLNPNNSWPMNQSNEFENREKYMETELTEEHYNSCDTNTNQNEIPDDEPYPPPGLRRLVTGQTVSFEDSPSSPPFDRVIPGEGSTFNTYPVPPPTNDPSVSERFVSGSRNKEYNPIPQHTFAAPPLSKKEPPQSYNNNSFYNIDNYTTHTVSSEDFFDSYLRPTNTLDERSGHQQQPKDKAPNYDHWYQNKAPSNVHNMDVKNYSNRARDEKSHNVQSPPVMTQFGPANVFDMNMHSKTPSMSSNTSSANEISSYQQNENYVNFDSPQKRNEEIDTTDRAAPRLDNQASVRLNETELKCPPMATSRFNSEPPIHDNHEINKESGHGYVVNDEYANTENTTLKSSSAVKETKIYHRNSAVENQELLDGGSSRGTVPGAQSTPTDSQRPFSNSSANASFSYGYQNASRLDNDDGERDETGRYSDSDEKFSMSQRMVPGYNYNTIPSARKNVSKSYQDSMSSKHTNSNKIEPPLETRMVVGETSSDVPRPSGTRGRGNERDRSYEEDKGRRTGRERERNEKGRKKPSRGRPRNESDEEYDEQVGAGYDISPDRGSRSYRDKHRRDSPPRYKKSMQRAERESSITQDDSYNDDDDDDRDTYRRCENRRYPRNRAHMYYPEQVEPDWGYYERPYWDRYPDDIYPRISRPSSRSGSELRRDPMDYNSSSRYANRFPPYNFEKPHAPTSNELQYWAKMRHIDPKAYMRWYRNAFPERYSEWYSNTYQKHQKSYQDDRRGSGHSGQSSINNDSVSVNDEKIMGIKDLSISGRVVESKNASAYERRNSPFKFKMSHVKGFFNSLGQLIVVNESCPKDGQTADVDVYEVSAPDDDPDIVEFMNFTGPFVVGETHVNTVSEFVRYHAAGATTPSEKLLYLLIDLLIRLRGVTDGIAISELLMNSYHESQKHNGSTSKEEHAPTLTKSSSNGSGLSENEIVERFTNLLLQGNKNVALEWAINNKLWGHAFLLASKIGNKYYSNVLAKFDASIPMNNPLKTLYQLYSNQIPQAATACGDEKWGDWRPHLAMILSNPSSDSEMDKAAIVTLGDSLNSKDIFASHFCYLAAEEDFEMPNKPSAKFSLLSLRNNIDHFGVNTCNHAILLTQIYEFAKRLQRKEYTISPLLHYKYLLAVRLIDFGRSSVALQYLESIAIDLLKNADDSNKDFIYNVLELAERIKYSDSKPLVADSSTDKPWLASLRQLVGANESQFISSSEQSTPNEVPRIDSPSQPYQQPQLPQAVPVQPSQQQQQPQQPPTPHMYSMPPSNNTVQQPSMFHPPPQPQIPSSASQPASLPSMYQDQPLWETKSYHYGGYGQQNTTLNNESPYGMDEPVPTQQSINDYNYMTRSTNERESNLYSPWDQPQSVGQISMHSKSNSFYHDESSKPVAKTKNNSTTATAATTTSMSTSTSTVSRTNRKLRKQVQASMANKQRYSVMRYYMSKRRADDDGFRAGRINMLGQLMSSAFYYDTLCNSKIVFNGTFPIDKPFGIRHSLRQKTSSNESHARKEEAVGSSQAAGNKEADKNGKDRKPEKENGGWLSSTFGKLIRPKNQMKLPDDKNPSIVWDAQKKQWVDKNAENDDSVSTIKPPPKASELRGFQPNTSEQAMPSVQPQLPQMSNVMPQAAPPNSTFGMQGNNSIPPALPPGGTNNIYKLQKGKGMKANYVNVLSQNTSSQPSSLPPSNLMMDSYSAASVPRNVNFFVPSSG